MIIIFVDFIDIDQSIIRLIVPALDVSTFKYNGIMKILECGYIPI